VLAAQMYCDSFAGLTAQWLVIEGQEVMAYAEFRSVAGLFPKATTYSKQASWGPGMNAQMARDVVKYALFEMVARGL